MKLTIPMGYFLHELFMAFSHACKISTRNGRFNAIPITLGTAIIASSSGTIYWANLLAWGFSLTGGVPFRSLHRTKKISIKKELP